MNTEENCVNFSVTRNNSNKKSNYFPILKNITLAIKKARYLTKVNTSPTAKILIDYVKINREYECVFKTYTGQKEHQKNDFSFVKRSRRTTTKSILVYKNNFLSKLYDKRVQQLMFVLKKTVKFSFQISKDADLYTILGLNVVKVFNAYNGCTDIPQVKKFSLNTCSNTYPSVLLPQSNLDFGVILKLITQRKLDQSVCDILITLIGDCQEPKNDNAGTSIKSKLLEMLIPSIINENDKSYYFGDASYKTWSVIAAKEDLFPNKRLFSFLYKESIFLSYLIIKCQNIVPSIFPAVEERKYFEKSNHDIFLKGGLRTIWTFMSTVFDHVVLWWIETPLSCYPLSYVDSFRNWIQDIFKETQEPVHSSLKAFGEILTIFISNNLWDRSFRETLTSHSLCDDTCNGFDKNERTKELAGKCWRTLFNQLKIHNNILVLSSNVAASQLAVSEQIPVLHRIDHSIHSMRIWAKEKCKHKSSKWIVDAVFQVLNHDVRDCLAILSLIDSRAIAIDHEDVLMTVCISLRAKLLLEIQANLLKLKLTSDECTTVLSTVCRKLSLASFSLCFPPRQYWQQQEIKETRTGYVSFVLDQIFLPALNATSDMVVLELILKFICEAWIDFIYSKKIKFTTCGALVLLNDFDEVRKWISQVPNLSTEISNNLIEHEVLHMCQGVAKVLVRKPREILSIVHSPKYNKSSIASSQNTRLPSEMFVSNQSHWLQLRMSSRKMICRECFAERADSPLQF